MNANHRVISVFGSSAPKPGSGPYEEAREIGRLLAQAGFTVATGGYAGTMTAVSQGAFEAGGHVIGVGSTRIETFRGIGVNPWVKEVVMFDNLSDRLIHLVTHNNGMIALPGGIGTLSEVALAWSFLQVSEIGRRPLVLLGDIWRDTLDAFIQPEYVQESHTHLLCFANTPESAVSHIVARLN